MDPLTVLQESDTGDLCDTEDGHHEGTHDDGGGLDVAGVSHTLHTGICDIMSGVNVEKCPGTRVSPHSSTPSRSNPPPSSSTQHSTHQTGGPNIGAAQQTWGVSGGILLDVSTAGNNLLISDDRRAATWTDVHQNRPETLERFQGPQVLSSQSFSSGRHSWEVDVEEAVVWRFGLCYPSIDRRGDDSKIGDNKKSWALERTFHWDVVNVVIHDRKEVTLPYNIYGGKFRIDLDCEAGQIIFYEVRNPIRLLYTITTTFTEPLHAVLYVGHGCVKI